MNSFPPLPANWTLKGDFYTSEDGCERYAKDDGGKVDRERIALTLENYGYTAHALNWRNPLFAELLDALKNLAANIDLSKLNVRKDFSLLNAHAAATKALFKAQA